MPRADEGTQSEKIRDYFNKINWMYENGFFGTAIHLGFWDRGAKSFAEAQDHLTEFHIEKVRPQSSERHLDVGCGSGRPAIQLAQAGGGLVTGINLSEIQVETAIARAAEAGLADRVRFDVGDMLKLPYENSSFDTAWEIEALYHVEDTERALAEIYRVLKPSGRFVVAEVICINKPSERDKEIFAYSGFPHAESDLNFYPKLIRDAGFEVLEEIDQTDRTKQSLLRRNEEIAGRKDELADYYGAEYADRYFDIALDAARMQSEVWGYTTVVARKPALDSHTAAAV
jgi:ubiquinone/menaquinone biosynthesis C-methylase UbiE